MPRISKKAAKNVEENDVYAAEFNDEIYVNADDVEIEDGYKSKRGSSSSNQTKASSTNLARRRLVHVTCEHRRRQEIQAALDSLQAELPSSSRPRSKGAIIIDSAELIKELTFQLDRLLNENQALVNQLQVNDFTTN